MPIGLNLIEACPLLAPWFHDTAGYGTINNIYYFFTGHDPHFECYNWNIQRQKNFFYLNTLSYPNAQLTTVYNIETMKFYGIEKN